MLVLNLKALVSFLELLVLFRVSVESSRIGDVRVKLGITEEINHFFECFFHHFHLLFIVSVSLRVKFQSCLLKIVGFCFFMAHFKHVLDSPLRICAFEVVFAKHEAHYLVEGRFRVEHKVFVANPQHWKFSCFGFIHDNLVPCSHLSCTVFDPPVPPVRILFLVLERWPTCVTAKCLQIEPRHHYVSRIANHCYHLVGSEGWCERD